MIRSASGPSARLLLTVLLPAAIFGCVRSAPSPHRDATEAVQRRGAGSLDRAVDFLFRMDEFQPGQVGAQISYQLNRWIETQQAPPGWTPDPLISTLPPRMRKLPPLQDEELAMLRFPDSDLGFLQGAVWLREISRWVAQQPSKDEPWRRWLEESDASLGASTVETLAAAERLFDWTVRNIQLKPLLPYPKRAGAGPTADGRASRDAAIPPPQRGVPGPGYQEFPRQVLLYGRGDAWQRARVFLLLARQQRIDVVMLAVDQQFTQPRYRPWLPAVLAGDQLYLFDPALGLPIPGPGGEGVASLEQVLDDPSLLRALDLDRRRRYPIAEDDLGKIVALVDAPPEYLTLRMQLLESKLTGNRQLTLTTSPTRVADQLKSCKGVGGTILWTIPYDTILYQMAYGVILGIDEEKKQSYFEELGIFLGLNPLVQGRHQHFRGVFENQDEKPGAKSRYLEVRAPDETIRGIETRETVQRNLGLTQGDEESTEDWQDRLHKATILQTRGKQDASYWLGLVHYETGNYEAAVEWLKNRTLEASPDGPWTSGARYNLARCYEAMGRLEEARKLYLADDSPQRYGDRLRARQLKRREEAQSDPESDAPNPKEDR